MVWLSSTAEMLRAIDAAREVTFCAYYLWGGAVEEKLEAAALRGASVHVRLEGFEDKKGAIEIANRNAVDNLRAAGVDARLVDQSKTDGPQMHLKAAICDGVAFLDDCNWRTSDDTVVRDNLKRDVHAIQDAALHRSVTTQSSIALNKTDALAREADLLKHARSGDRVDVESETISYNSNIYSALKKLPGEGVHCRVLANYKRSNARERRALHRLAEAGVNVRVTNFNEKLAVVNGSKAWIGSANATSTFYNPTCIDWGTQTQSPQLVRTMQSQFNAHWNSARAVAKE